MWILLFKNIKSFIKTKPVLFAFILVSQIVCILATFTVAGMIDAATPKPEDERGDYQKSFDIVFGDYHEKGNEEDIFMNKVYDIKTGKLLYCGLDEDKANSFEDENASHSTIDVVSYNLPYNYKNLPSYKDVKDKINTFLKQFTNKIYYADISGYTDKTCTVDFTGITGVKEFMELRYPYFKDAPLPIAVSKTENYDTVFSKYSIGDKLTLNSTEYTIVANVEEYRLEDACIMEFENTPDDFLVVSFFVYPDDNATAADRYNMETYIKENLGDIAVKIKNPEPEPLIEKQFNNMIYVVSFIMIAVVLLNISRLYSYILSKRQRTLAVFELCGAGKGQMFSLYFLEVFITLAVSFAMGFAIFRFAGIGLLNSVYPDLQEFFTAQIYLTIFGAYMLIGSLIMAINILPLVAKSAVDLKRR